MHDGDTIDDRIAAAMEAQRWEDARALIQRALARMPADWKPVEEDEKFIRRTFWNHNEFLAYVGSHRGSGEKAVLWTSPSYSKLWWQLAVAMVQLGRLDNAAICVDSGIAAEPDHPMLWIERGYLLNRTGRPEEALQAYRTAATVRTWTPGSMVARALRGQGSALIDLGRLDEARHAYRHSLELEARNESASQELEYIDRLLEEQKARARSVPWFLHCLRHPPTDPLTQQLRVLAEGLTPIPGPQTMGAENYSKILKAFLEHGWAGFEEAFDAVVPRPRGDYADVKRELLREPIFSAKVHSRMARLHKGQATVDEIMSEIAREKTAQKQ